MTSVRTQLDCTEQAPWPTLLLRTPLVEGGMLEAEGFTRGTWVCCSLSPDPRAGSCLISARAETERGMLSRRDIQPDCHAGGMVPCPYPPSP